MPSNDPLLHDLRSMLSGASPMLFIEASSALAALQPDATPGIDGRHVHATQDISTVITQLAPTFVTNDDPETNAVLRVWAEMLGDDMLRRRVLHSVSPREHPDWLDDVPHTRIMRVLGMGDAFGEEETVLLEAHIGTNAFTLACAVRSLGGSHLEDAYLLPATIAEAFNDIPAEVASTITLREIPLPGAHTLLTEALELSSRIYPPIETQSWPLTRPILTWFLRLLPQEATDPAVGLAAYSLASEAEYARAEAELKDVTSAFTKSLEGMRLPPGTRQEARLVFELQQNYGTGDLMRWGPQFVESLMLDLYPRKYLAPDQILLQLPRLLNAIVTWANGQSGISADETEQVLRRITKLTPEYRRIVKQGHSDPLAGLVPPPWPDMTQGGAVSGHTDDPGPFGAAEALDSRFLDSYLAGDTLDISRFMRHQLEHEVGGADELDALDAEPLRLESLAELLDSYDVEDDLLPRLRTVADLISEHGGRLFGDPELVTVALRVLVSSAAFDPAVYRRRAKDDITAAACCWVAARNNHWFKPYRGAARSPQSLTTAFDIASVPQQRGLTILSALGVQRPMRVQDLSIGDPLYLTSTRRAALITERDALTEGL